MVHGMSVRLCSVLCACLYQRQMMMYATAFIKIVIYFSQKAKANHFQLNRLYNGWKLLKHNSTVTFKIVFFLLCP
jgi:hypothetical protein